MYDYSNYKLKRIIEHENYLNKLKRIKSKKLITPKNSELENNIKQVYCSEDNSKNVFYLNKSSLHCDSKVDNQSHQPQNQHKLDIKNVHIKIEKVNDNIYNTYFPFLNQDINDKKTKKIREFPNTSNDLYYLNKDQYELEEFKKCDQKFHGDDHKKQNEKVDSALKKLNNLGEQHRKGYVT